MVLVILNWQIWAVKISILIHLFIKEWICESDREITKYQFRLIVHKPGYKQSGSVPQSRWPLCRHHFT